MDTPRAAVSISHFVATNACFMAFAECKRQICSVVAPLPKKSLRGKFFGSPVFILVRTAMQLCPHSHISLRYVVAANFAFHASVLTHIRKLCFVASPLPTKILRLFVGALPYPVRPCRGLLRRIGLTCFFFSSPPKFIFCREPVRSSASLALFRQCKSPAAVRGRAASYYVD